MCVWVWLLDSCLGSFGVGCLMVYDYGGWGSLLLGCNVRLVFVVSWCLCLVCGLRCRFILAGVVVGGVGLGWGVWFPAVGFGFGLVVDCACALVVWVL